MKKFVPLGKNLKRDKAGKYALMEVPGKLVAIGVSYKEDATKISGKVTLTDGDEPAIEVDKKKLATYIARLLKDNYEDFGVKKLFDIESTTFKVNFPFINSLWSVGDPTGLVLWFD